MGLLRHDGEVEGVVVEDDAVLVLGIRGTLCPRTRILLQIFCLSLGSFDLSCDFNPFVI